MLMGAKCKVSVGCVCVCGGDIILNAIATTRSCRMWLNAGLSLTGAGGGGGGKGGAEIHGGGGVGDITLNASGVSQFCSLLSYGGQSHHRQYP